MSRKDKWVMVSLVLAVFAGPWWLLVTLGIILLVPNHP